MAPFDMLAVNFRNSNDKECFSSESFLMPYDLRRMFLRDGRYAVPYVVNTYEYDNSVSFKDVFRHWAARWRIDNIENGARVATAKTIIGLAEEVAVTVRGRVSVCARPWLLRLISRLENDCVREICPWPESEGP